MSAQLLGPLEHRSTRKTLGGAKGLIGANEIKEEAYARRIYHIKSSAQDHRYLRQVP